jgi:hypothetical protein
MSGARIIFPEFRDEQSDSRYPFADTALLTANTGQMLPRDAFFDAALYIINATAPLYIYSIKITTGNVEITIGGDGNQQLATAAYDPLNPPKNGQLPVIDIHGRPAGMLLAKDRILAYLGSWELATHIFTPTATEFVSSVVMPAKEPGVRALAVNSLGEFLTGDIWLVGRDGVVLRKDTREENTIRVDIVGVPLFKRLPCDGEKGKRISNFAPRDFLRTINGCTPDEFGNFSITVAAKTAPDSTLRIYPENDALKINVVGTKVI